MSEMIYYASRLVGVSVLAGLKKRILKNSKDK